MGPDIIRLVLGPREAHSQVQASRNINASFKGLPCSPFVFERGPGEPDGGSCRVPGASPPGPLPGGSCPTQLAKDGCSTDKTAKLCEACAALHKRDLQAAGCTQKAVKQLCEGTSPSPGPAPGPGPGPGPGPAPGPGESCAAREASLHPNVLEQTHLSKKNRISFFDIGVVLSHKLVLSQM